MNEDEIYQHRKRCLARAWWRKRQNQTVRAQVSKGRIQQTYSQRFQQMYKQTLEEYAQEFRSSDKD